MAEGTAESSWLRHVEDLLSNVATSDEVSIAATRLRRAVPAQKPLPVSRSLQRKGGLSVKAWRTVRQQHTLRSEAGTCLAKVGLVEQADTNRDKPDPRAVGEAVELPAEISSRCRTRGCEERCRIKVHEFRIDWRSVWAGRLHTLLLLRFAHLQQRRDRCYDVASRVRTGSGRLRGGWRSARRAAKRGSGTQHGKAEGVRSVCEGRARIAMRDRVVAGIGTQTEPAGVTANLAFPLDRLTIPDPIFGVAAARSGTWRGAKAKVKAKVKVKVKAAPAF